MGWFSGCVRWVLGRLGVPGGAAGPYADKALVTGVETARVGAAGVELSRVGVVGVDNRVLVTGEL